MPTYDLHDLHSFYHLTMLCITLVLLSFQLPYVRVRLVYYWIFDSPYTLRDVVHASSHSFEPKLGAPDLLRLAVLLTWPVIF